jgi:hypothetical protein
VISPKYASLSRTTPTALSPSATKCHTVLHGDAAAQRFDAFDVVIGDRFAAVEESVEPLERDFAVHFFIDVQNARDRLVVGGMKAERPAVLYEVSYHGF